MSVLQDTHEQMVKLLETARRTSEDYKTARKAFNDVSAGHTLEPGVIRMVLVIGNVNIELAVPQEDKDVLLDKLQFAMLQLGMQLKATWDEILDLANQATEHLQKAIEMSQTTPAAVQPQAQPQALQPPVNPNIMPFPNINPAGVPTPPATPPIPVTRTQLPHGTTVPIS